MAGNPAERINRYPVEGIFRVAIGAFDKLSHENALSVAVNAANSGHISPGVVFDRFGIRGLMQVDRDKSTLFIKQELERRNRIYHIEESLGLTGSADQQGLPVSTIEAIIPWIPVVQASIEQKPDFMSWYDAKRVEDFFAGFPYREAVPHLLNALASKATVNGEKLGEEVVGKTGVRKHIRDEDVGGGSWNGSWEGYDSYYEVYEADLIEGTFVAINPIAEGAKRSLLKIANDHPELRNEIQAGTSEFDSRERETVRLRYPGENETYKEIDITRTITRSEYDAR